MCLIPQYQQHINLRLLNANSECLLNNNFKNGTLKGLQQSFTTFKSHCISTGLTLHNSLVLSQITAALNFFLPYLLVQKKKKENPKPKASLI